MILWNVYDLKGRIVRHQDRHFANRAVKEIRRLASKATEEVVTRNARGQLMSEQQPKAPNVALARRWAESILLAYAVIPVLFFVFLLLFPQSRDDALMATGEVYLGNLWMIGLAYVAY